MEGMDVTGTARQSDSVRVAVVGLGFMGRTHAAAAGALAARGDDVRIAAVLEPGGSPRSGAGVSDNLAVGGGSEEALVQAAWCESVEATASTGAELAIVCTPTHTHVDVACEMLRAGMHVLLEKPVALRSSDVDLLERAERENGRRVIPAMCMRHWPGWTWLREVIAGTRAEAREFGPLRALRLTRLGSRPAWSSFYQDDEQCGGAMLDLHVHDVDFLILALGRPTRVRSVGSVAHVLTTYAWERAAGPSPVSAEGGWLASPGRGFRMRFSAEFERATAEFDLAREPRLSITRDGAAHGVPLDGTAGYEPQLAHALACVRAWRRGEAMEPAATLADARAGLRVIEAERKSLRACEEMRVDYEP